MTMFGRLEANYENRQRELERSFNIWKWESAIVILAKKKTKWKDWKI